MGPSCYNAGVARFLSPAWLAALNEAAAGDEARAATAGLSLTLQQRVTGGPDGDVAYALRIDRGTVEVTPGEDPGADAAFSQDWATAVAVARGELPAATAFVAGRIKVAGRLDALLRHQGALAHLERALAPVRERTTYGPDA